MRKPKIEMTVIEEDTGYSAHTLVGDSFIATEGETCEELKANVLEAVNLTFVDKGLTYTEADICFNLG